MIKKQLITIQHSISQVPYHKVDHHSEDSQKETSAKATKGIPPRKVMKFIYFNPNIYPFHPASDKQISPSVVFFPK